MRRRKTLSFACTLLMLLAFGTGTAMGAEYDDDEVELATDLSGDEGEGEAEIVINLETDEVCFDIEWEDADAPNSGHIHEEGQGDVAVDLTPGFDAEHLEDDEEVESCLEAEDHGADHDTLRDIADNPRDYVVDLHNDDGDLRGQLAYD